MGIELNKQRKRLQKSVESDKLSEDGESPLAREQLIKDTIRSLRSQAKGLETQAKKLEALLPQTTE